MKILNWILFLEGIVGDKPISDKDLYISNMNTTISDKIFFTDIVHYDVIVDFGCANGELLKTINSKYPNVKLIGYDIDSEMLEKAKKNLNNKNIVLTNNWDVVITNLSGYKNTLLNLSSVIHEVYSYSSPSVINQFWNNIVFSGDFKYIIIRDMIPSVEISKSEISHFKDDARKVRLSSNSKLLSSFENIWGSINTSYKNLVHFLLKYKYVDNWDREVRENYLPISLEYLKSKIPYSYKIVYEENFVLPYLKREVKKDFGIDLIHSTHTKMIIKNLKYK